MLEETPVNKFRVCCDFCGNSTDSCLLECEAEEQAKDMNFHKLRKYGADGYTYRDICDRCQENPSVLFEIRKLKFTFVKRD